MPSSSITVAISLLSLAIAGVTLYLTQFRPAKLSTIVGPGIKIYYPKDGGFGIYVPVTFVNRSPRTAVVFRCGITIFRKSTPQQKFYMEWRRFMKLKEDGGSFITEEDAHSIAVPNNSFLSKLIWVTWRYFINPPFRIIEDEYVLYLHYWPRSSGKPISSKHEFLITNEDYLKLEGFRAAKENTVVDVDLDANVRFNILMNASESKSLLGI
jgi:hypothetical protein